MLEIQRARLDTIRRSVFLDVPGRSRSSVAAHAELLDLIAAGAPVDRIQQVARAHKLLTSAAVSLPAASSMYAMDIRYPKSRNCPRSTGWR